MRVYQYMSAEHALQNLKNRRLKVSLLDDLNDPFELLGAQLERAQHRTQMRKWRQYMNSITRLLCFSTTYMNPVMWSHYADKHHGICLAFNVPNEFLVHVQYDANRLVVDFEKEARRVGGIGSEIVDRLLRTKYVDWEYESEVRMFVRPEEVESVNGLQFFPFGDNLKIEAVYVGPRCTVTKAEVKRALRAEDQRVLVHATRLAFKSYRVLRTPWQTRHLDAAAQPGAPADRLRRPLS